MFIALLRYWVISWMIDVCKFSLELLDNVRGFAIAVQYMLFFYLASVMISIDVKILKFFIPLDLKLFQRSFA